MTALLEYLDLTALLEYIDLLNRYSGGPFRLGPGAKYPSCPPPPPPVGGPGRIRTFASRIRTFVTGSVKKGHNRTSLYLQYKAFNTLGEILAYY